MEKDLVPHERLLMLGKYSWRDLLQMCVAKAKRMGITPRSFTNTGTDVFSVATVELIFPCFPYCHQPLQPHNLLPCCCMQHSLEC